MKEILQNVQVKRSKAGLGLYAQKKFIKGECIIEYTGERISHEEADRRAGKYLFILSDTIVIDGKGREHTARYINHACKPNAESEVSDDEQHVYIKAKKAINIGEEITYDYGKEYWEAYIKPYGCRCSSCDVG